MYRYPGNHVDSGIVTVPRKLKTRPGAQETHLAYITPDEEKILQQYKPGTPHRGPEEIPNYDTWSWDSSGTQTGGSTADSGSGSGWESNTNNNNNNNNSSSNSNYNPWQHAAQTYEDAGAVTSSALSGTALWKQDGLPEGVYHSTYQQGQQGYSPTGYIYIDPEGDGTPQALGRDKDGNIVWDPSAYEWDPYNQKWFRSNYTPWNSHATTHHGGGGGDGGGWRGSWGNFGNWGGSSQYGNPYGRYSKANWHLKNKYNYDSPIAALFAERRANPIRPRDIEMYAEMMANMNKGGIMGLRR